MPHRWVCGVLLITGLVLSGCGDGRTRIDFQIYDQGSPRTHYAEFPRATYHLAPNGTLELALRVDRPSTADPTLTITQIFYLKTFWNPRPGTTYAEASQINARVEYAILTPPTGVRYEGAAFVSYRLDAQTGLLEGRLESGSLSPRQRIGHAVEPFGACHFTGRFRAVDNPRAVVGAVAALRSAFPPGPRNDVTR